MTAFPPISRITAVAAPLVRDNVDTDAIIPSREMRSTGKTGLADGLFAGWRYRDAGARTPDPDFVLNRPDYRDAGILIAGANFGSGSSREHAVWALTEYGVRAVIAESFAPIFLGNCIRNGLVPAAIARDGVEAIAAAVAADPLRTPVTVDVAGLSVALPDGRSWSFPLGGEAQSMLLEGADAIDLTLKHREEIERFQTRDRAARPWIYLGAGA